MKWFSALKTLKFPFLEEKKSKLILICFLTGILFLSFPSNNKKETSNTLQPNKINQEEPSKKELEKLLLELTGTKVRVLFSYEDNGSVEVVSEEKNVVQNDPNQKTSRIQTDRKPILDSNKNIIIQKQTQPKIKGVCIFYFGPYHAKTEELLCRAASSALGAQLHTVEVLFMP